MWPGNKQFAQKYWEQTSSLEPCLWILFFQVWCSRALFGWVINKPPKAGFTTPFQLLPDGPTDEWMVQPWMEVALFGWYSTGPRGLEGKAAQPLSLKVNIGYLYITAGFSLPLARDQPVLYLERAILPAFKTGGATKHPGHQAAFHTGCFIYLRGRGKQNANMFSKNILGKKKNTSTKEKCPSSPSNRLLLVPVRNTSAHAAGKQSTKINNNNNSFSLFACITRPQFSLQHPVQLVFPLIIVNQACS